MTQLDMILSFYKYSFMGSYTKSQCRGEEYVDMKYMRMNMFAPNPIAASSSSPTQLASKSQTLARLL